MSLSSGRINKLVVSENVTEGVNCIRSHDIKTRGAVRP